jgi:Protein of unknown function (DUF3618)
MGEEPAAIREAIEETREHLGETLQDLAEKADVKARAKEWVGEKREVAVQKLEQTKESAAHAFDETKAAVSSRLEDVKAKGSNGDGGVDVVAIGKAGLTGVKAKVADRVSGPVASRTGLTRDQVEAIIGAVFLAVAAWQFVRLMRRVVRAGRGDLESD